MGFIGRAFSDAGEPSSGRIMTLLHFLMGGAWGSHVVYHNHAMLDPTHIVALTGFITAPYALTAGKSTLTNIFGNGKPPTPGA